MTLSRCRPASTSRTTYPQKEFRVLEPLESRRLDMNREVVVTLSAVRTTIVPGNVRVISEATDVSSIANGWNAKECQCPD